MLARLVVLCASLMTIGGAVAQPRFLSPVNPIGPSNPVYSWNQRTDKAAEKALKLKAEPERVASSADQDIDPPHPSATNRPTKTINAPYAGGLATASGDFDGDGKMDVVLFVADHAGGQRDAVRLYFFKGNGQGQFSLVIK